jgi:hypothetical protein
MYPEPFQWTTESGLTHIFYTNHLPPGGGFGWSSLCDEWHLPIEGEHIEVQEDIAEGSITCEGCLDQSAKAHVDPNADDMVRMRSCLIRISRDKDGNLIDAHRLCRRQPLNQVIEFEPESFSGDLREEVNEVCEACWQRYFDNQWSGDAEGGELKVKCWTDEGKQTYYAVSVDAINTGGKAKVQLTSENGLIQEFPREKVELITLTPAQIVDY